MARILMADDEEALRHMMGRQLRRAGHDVILAEDGLIALDLLGKEKFDVVISDMKMPRLDGMGLLARAKEVAPDTEFVVLTGHGSMENAVEAFKAGNVFDYLLKPLEDIRELDAVVTRAVERRQLRSDNARLVVELEAKVDDLEKAKQKLADLAERDSLTGLLNHRAIHAKLEMVVQATPGDGLAVMMLDLDGFKRFNDVYGHPVGDQVLRYIADGLKLVCGARAFLGRCGGDEFMAVLPGATADASAEMAEKIRLYTNEQPFKNPDGMALPMPLCFGIADVASAGRSAAGLVAAADSALYTGKSRGGDTVTLHMVQDPNEEVEPGRTAFGVLDGLVTAIDNKDRYTKKHSEDVTQYALQLVNALDLSEEVTNAVRLAGLLHDVGKIGVPDCILRKPGKLTADEYEVMKSHVTISGLIIHGLPRLPDIIDAVAHHHERWDGKGYPKGLAGEQIPLLGRVMAIADAFSAMTLDRPYRAGRTIEEALAEIEKGAGTQFDPDLAQVFIKTIREHAARELPKAA